MSDRRAGTKSSGPVARALKSDPDRCSGRLLGGSSLSRSLKGALARLGPSEVHGRRWSVSTEPQDEATPVHPCSPYGVVKVYPYWARVNYREVYSMHISNGILFNHDSPYAKSTTEESGMLVDSSRDGLEVDLFDPFPHPVPVVVPDPGEGSGPHPFHVDLTSQHG